MQAHHRRRAPEARSAKVGAHLLPEAPEEPCFLCNPEVLLASYRRFLQGFPGEVTYAVKANPDAWVLEHLAAAGMQSFDVASVAEMALVRRIAPGARLHYHNPIRSRSEIAAARRYGVVSWSIDRMSELDKLGNLDGPGTAGGLRGMEIAVRLRRPMSGAAYDFGTKFGADRETAIALLRAVVARGGLPSVTFHPGTQCTDPGAWRGYVEMAAEVAAAAGCRLHRLNVGGGFPARRGGTGWDLETLFAAIAEACAAAFGGPAATPRLVCEPGRALVAEAVHLVVQVKAISGGCVFLDDGIYGALAEWRDIGTPGRIVALSAGGHPRRGADRLWQVFGPTCDSLDRLEAPVPLPADLNEGDHLLIGGMGAYTGALVTGFNGYGTTRRVMWAQSPAARSLT